MALEKQAVNFLDDVIKPNLPEIGAAALGGTATALVNRYVFGNRGWENALLAGIPGATISGLLAHAAKTNTKDELDKDTALSEAADDVIKDTTNNFTPDGKPRPTPNAATIIADRNNKSDIANYTDTANNVEKLVNTVAVGGGAVGGAIIGNKFDNAGMKKLPFMAYSSHTAPSSWAVNRQLDAVKRAKKHIPTGLTPEALEKDPFYKTYIDQKQKYANMLAQKSGKSRWGVRGANVAKFFGRNTGMIVGAPFGAYFGNKLSDLVMPALRQPLDHDQVTTEIANTVNTVRNANPNASIDSQVNDTVEMLESRGLHISPDKIRRIILLQH